uniref:CD209 antigen n=1 Tax=Culex pipiens TaxID=7175 RepID=A0A8D8I408_CULPI
MATSRILKIVLLLLYCSISITSGQSKKQYHVYYDRLVNFYGAVSACHSYGQRLATVTSAEDTSRLQQAIAKTSRSGLFFTAGYDSGHNGEWVWFPNGTKISTTGYSNWHSSQPDNHEERCLEVGRFPGTMWNDISCSAALFYICEEQD